MLPVLTHELRRFLRAPALLVWAVAFPLVLTVVFMLLFSGIKAALTPEPLALGVVQDQAYDSSPGLDALVQGLSDPAGQSHYVDVSPYATEAEALEAARAGRTAGYLVVTGGRPALHLTIAGNETITSVVVRRYLDAYEQTSFQARQMLGSGVGPERLSVLQDQQAFTRELVVTPDGVGSTSRYYFALLAFTAGMGMMLAVQAVQGVAAPSGALGARRTLAGLPRWKVLTGVLGAAWLCTTAAVGIGFVFMWAVAGVGFGPRAHLAPVLVLASGLMSCAAGAALGTVPRLSAGTVSGLSSLLSLFTGLYGPGSQQIADLVAKRLPVLAWVNPLWQSARGYYSLFYYDSLGPFVESCASLVAMSAVFFVIAVLRLRRMSHDHL